MNTTERLAFRLVIAEPNTTERTITVCPRYDGLKLKWSRPSGQMYYTEDISGTVKFLGVDFHTINACALNTQFTFIVYQNRVEVGRSIFKKTDCKWDIDHGVVEVDVSVYDKYKKFQDKKDEEYNLIKLGLEKKQLSLKVYPSRQIYVEGDTKAVLFSGTDRNEVTTEERRLALSWNEPSSSNTDTMENDLAHGWRFGYCARIFIVIDVKEEESATFADRYVVSGYTYVSVDGGSLKMDVVTGTGIINGNSITAGYNGTQLYGTLSHGTEGVYFAANGTFDNIFLGTNLLLFSPLSGHGDRFNSSCRMWVTWSRLACYSSPLSNVRTLSNDLVENSNMKYAVWPERHDATTNPINVAVSNRVSDTPTEYGIVEGTSTYYLPPDDTHKWTALRQDSWMRGISFWAGENYTTQYERQWYTGNENVKDFYTLGDAIKAVVNKIDENIVFVPDAEHSQFLFSPTNPLTGIQQGALYISQKSNILNLGYDYPAWMAPVKWSQIETLLREAFDCYWSLYDRDGQKHLRIEHRKWYENGGNYTQSGVQVATIDLTSTFRNGTPFTFGEKTRHWEFDTDGNGTVSTASRHEYGWMDTQSEIFDGQPITVPEAYRLFTDEKVEQHKVDWFSSDIDFLTSVQAECSSDGFVLVMENPNRPNWIVTGASEYSGQNYQLSFDYLQDKYLLQGIYAEVVMIGDNETLTNSNARMRTSEVQLRSVDGMEINASDTIKTAVGIGVIDTLEYDLHSQLYTVKLRYENE